MYNCANCNAEAIEVDGKMKLSCSCTRKVKDGKKYFIFNKYKTIPEKIIMDMGEVTCVGVSKSMT